MRRIHQDTIANNAPETTGATIHTASRYDLHTSLLGLGVNGSNSRMIIEMAKIKPGDKVLDVGCGSGNLTLTVKRYAGASGSVYGIDASPEMIEVARKKAERNSAEAIFEVGLIEKLPYAEITFDVVISRLVIHHLPDDLKRTASAEVFRVLKPGGLFFIADFTNPTRMLGASPALLQGKILRGGMGTGMPMWGSIFTEQQIWDLIAYLYSFQFEYEK